MDDASWHYVLHNAFHAEAMGLAIARQFMQGKPGTTFGYWLKK